MENNKKFVLETHSRSRKKRYARKRFLIVTEKSKSEISYFTKLREELKLSENEVTIIRSTGSSPRNVVETAEQLISKADRDELSVVYCVFDRDTHSTYSKALDKIKTLRRKYQSRCDSVQAIVSIPCFEYWYLLHVKDSRQVFGKSGSPCSNLIKILTGFSEFTLYDKADCSNFYHNIEKKRPIAVKRAKASLKDAHSTGESEFQEDPSTRVYLVVEAMQSLAKEINP